jgi:DNA primase
MCKSCFASPTQVVFSFDGDAAGRRAARKALDGALPHATDTRSGQVPVPAARARPGQLCPRRIWLRRLCPHTVRDAVPLSRFLIEAASEGCDLGTAEGRAHLASQRPATCGAAAARGRAGGASCWARSPSWCSWTRTTCPTSGAMAGTSPGRYQKESTPRRQTDEGYRPKTPAARQRRAQAAQAGLRQVSRADHAARLLLGRRRVLGQPVTRNARHAVRAGRTTWPPVRLAGQPVARTRSPTVGRRCARRLQGHESEALAMKLMADAQDMPPPGR